MYVKFEGSFNLHDVKTVDRVLTSSASKFCHGKRSDMKKAGKLAAKFARTALKIGLGEGKFIIMEMLREQEFVQFINKE